MKFKNTVARTAITVFKYVFKNLEILIQLNMWKVITYFCTKNFETFFLKHNIVPLGNFEIQVIFFWNSLLFSVSLNI